MTRRSAKYGRYSMKEHGQSSQDRFSGVYLLNQGSDCTVRKPSWFNTRTVVRPLPGRLQDDETKLAPCRRSEDPGDWGDWIRRYDAVTNFGPSRITFITKDPRDPKQLHDHPCTLLRKAIRAAVRSGNYNPAWGPLVVAGDSGEPLRTSTNIYVMQVIMLEHMSKIMQPPAGLLAGDATVVLMTSSTAGRALLTKMDEKEDDKYKYWDIVDLHAGAYVQFSQAGSQSSAGSKQATSLGQQAAFGGVHRAQSVAERASYDVEIFDDYNGTPASLDGVVEQICDKIKPWDDIINIPTMEEQVELICRCGIPADAIMYALADLYRDIIPADIVESVQQRTHATGFSPEIQAAPTNTSTELAAVGGLGDYIKQQGQTTEAPKQDTTDGRAEHTAPPSETSDNRADTTGGSPAEVSSELKAQADKTWQALKMAEERSRHDS